MRDIFQKLIGKMEEKSFVDYEEYYTSGGECLISVSDIKEIVNELAEEFATDINVGNKDGWIPCSERLPETNESVLCWAKSTARGGDVCFVGSCHNGFWFLQSSADTHSFPGQYEVVAWQPLPQPYKEEGE